MSNDQPDIDWELLRHKAIEAAQRSYSPYSRYPVGAAGLTTAGTIVSGCNVENASYGLTFCAEITMVGMLRMTDGDHRLVAVCTVTGDGGWATPCGRCRQILMEHGGPGLLVNGDGTVRTMAELLPGAFTQDDLDAHQRP